MLAGKTISECLKQGVLLSEVSETPRLEIELFLSEILQKDRSFLFTWPEYSLNSEQLLKLDSLIERRAKGEPVAHLLGHREFWTLDLDVTPTTLIPRSDTELLVEIAIEKLSSQAELLDLGTGTGAVALAIASELPELKVSATDIDQESVALAKRNAAKHSISNITIFQSDWFQQVNGRFDVIVSNPPYIEENDVHLSRGDLRFEPRRALVSGADGLEDIRHISDKAKQFLKPNGWLMFEHGWKQGPAVREILSYAGFLGIETRTDLGGNERVSLGYLL